MNTILENIYNKERFSYTTKPESKFVDGVEYIKVIRLSTQKEALIRKDSVKVVTNKTRLK